MRSAPPPRVIRPPNAAADHQFVGAQLYLDGLNILGLLPTDLRSVGHHVFATRQPLRFWVGIHWASSFTRISCPTMQRTACGGFRILVLGQGRQPPLPSSTVPFPPPTFVATLHPKAIRLLKIFYSLKSSSKCTTF